MKSAGILFVLILGLLVLAGIVQLTRRRHLSMGLGVFWSCCVSGLMLTVGIKPIRELWIQLSVSVFDSPPYIVVLTLFLLIFLLYISVVISRMQTQMRDVVQAISMDKDDNGNRNQ